MYHLSCSSTHTQQPVSNGQAPPSTPVTALQALRLANSIHGHSRTFTPTLSATSLFPSPTSPPSPSLLHASARAHTCINTRPTDTSSPFENRYVYTLDTEFGGQPRATRPTSSPFENQNVYTLDTGFGQPRAHIHTHTGYRRRFAQTQTGRSDRVIGTTIDIHTVRSVTAYPGSTATHTRSFTTRESYKPLPVSATVPHRSISRNQSASATAHRPVMHRHKLVLSRSISQLHGTRFSVQSPYYPAPSTPATTLVHSARASTHTRSPYAATRPFTTLGRGRCLANPVFWFENALALATE